MDTSHPDSPAPLLPTAPRQELIPTLHWHYSEEAVNWAELSALYLRVGMGEKPPEKLNIAFANSLYKCFVFDEAQRLVAAGRALADGTDCSYICDIAIQPEWQGHGLGSLIVQKLLDFSAGHRKIILYAVPGKEAFYARFGFRRMRTAMAIFQNPEIVLERGYIE